MSTCVVLDTDEPSGLAGRTPGPVPLGEHAATITVDAGDGRLELNVPARGGLLLLA